MQKKYIEGDEVPQSYGSAFKWLKMAIADNYTRAQVLFDKLIEEGQDPMQPYDDNFENKLLAAEGGDEDAQIEIGEIYYYGEIKGGEDIALKIFKKLAEKGNTKAEYYAGVLQLDRNEFEAIKLFRLPAYKGHAGAQCNLGYMFKEGKGVVKSDEDAVGWFRMAAEQNSPVGQYNLGVMHYEGRAVVKSNLLATKWFKLAADQGYADAQYALAEMYWGSLFGPKKEAIPLYIAAAEQGHAKAQLEIGIRYKNGNGVDQSYEEATKWLKMAADQGNQDAWKVLDNMHNVKKHKRW